MSEIKNIIIFGCGESGISTFKRIKNIRRINIIGFTDNDANKWGSILMDRPVFKVPEALDGRADLILIASEWHDEIFTQLLSLGIDSKLIKIIPKRIRRANTFKNTDGNNLRLAELILSELSIFLDNNSIQYYLHGGTLLGAVRERRLLPWDHDLDILIDPIFSDFLERIALEFKRLIEDKYNYDVKIEYHFYAGKWKKFDKEKPARIFLNFKDSLKINQVQLDLSRLKKYNDNFIWAFEDKIYYAPLTFFKNGSKIKFINNEFTIPFEFNEFLTLLYGEWSRPIKNWDHSFQKNWYNKI